MDASYCSPPLAAAIRDVVPWTHFKQLEAESLHIMHEVSLPNAAVLDREDAGVLLHLALKAR
jgi:hypothetical protein